MKTEDMYNSIEGLAEQIQKTKAEISHMQNDVRHMEQELIVRLADEGSFHMLKIDWARIGRRLR
jgi:regulator of replication initiation timing